MKSNAIRLYKNCCEMVENPKGADSTERSNVRKKAIIGKAMWEERFKTSKKYSNDEEIRALLGVPKEQPKEEQPKDNGKKSKR